MKKIKIDKDSHGTIALMWLISAALAFCDLYFIHNPWVSMPVLALILAFSFFVFWFHRVPDRVLPEGDEGLVTSVADGKVVMTGREVLVQRAKDQMTGTKITIWLNDERVECEPARMVLQDTTVNSGRGGGGNILPK